MADIQVNPQVQTTTSVSSSKRGAGQPGAVHVTSTEHEKAQRLAKACADFEAIFVEQLFKTMRASVPESGLMNGGRAEEIYTAMLDQQIAQEMALGQGSTGLAKQMHSKLGPKVIGRTGLAVEDG
jgi:flagellar protein FlgJ